MKGFRWTVWCVGKVKLSPDPTRSKQAGSCFMLVLSRYWWLNSISFSVLTPHFCWSYHRPIHNKHYGSKMPKDFHAVGHMGSEGTGGTHRMTEWGDMRGYDGCHFGFSMCLGEVLSRSSSDLILFGYAAMCILTMSLDFFGVNRRCSCLSCSEDPRCSFLAKVSNAFNHDWTTSITRTAMMLEKSWWHIYLDDAVVMLVVPYMSTTDRLW